MGPVGQPFQADGPEKVRLESLTYAKWLVLRLFLTAYPEMRSLL
jgi:hypothetical protein